MKRSTITDAPPPFDAFTPFQIQGAAEATGVNLVAIAGVPLGSAAFLFAKADAFHWETDFTERVQGLAVTRLSRSESDTKLTWGGGRTALGRSGAHPSRVGALRGSRLGHWRQGRRRRGSGFSGFDVRVLMDCGDAAVHTTCSCIVTVHVT
jgi:hypothetical protein